MENQNVLTKQEFFESMKLCAAKCQANPELRVKMKNAPVETFKEITGKVCPKEGFKLTEEEVVALRNLISKEFPKGCCELKESQLTDVSGGQQSPVHWHFDFNEKLFY